MTPENFVYWLNGFFEIADPETLSEKQVAQIKKHLALVLTNVTDEEDVPSTDNKVVIRKQPNQPNLSPEVIHRIVNDRKLIC